MLRVGRSVVIGLGFLLALLVLLSATVGLGVAGWSVGLASGAGLAVLLVRALVRNEREGLGPADRITLVRAVLACAVAALAVPPSSVPVLVALSALVLILDGVDGRVARRTGTTSAFGARFDFEVDAFLILVLSAFVASEWGWWVLSLGVARYVYVAAGRAFPWLRGDPPPRRWGRVVAVVVGVTLTVAAAGVLPDRATLLMLLGALFLLAESFGRSVWVLWRASGGVAFPRPPVVAALALLLVWAALLLPDSVYDVSPSAFLRVPVEGLVFVALVLLMPGRAARTLAVLGGLALALLMVLRLLDMGFKMAFDSAFHPLHDAAYADSALGLLRDSVGPAGANAVLVGVCLLVLALLTLLPLAALRLTRAVDRHRRGSLRVLAALIAVTLVAGVSGPWLRPAEPIASLATARLAYAHATQVRDDLRSHREFEAALQHDPFEDTPASDLLTGLRGKDVLLIFVESYGRTALDYPVVQSALASGADDLHAAGFSARSGFLTSSTFGGLSWLAHITTQSGVRVDNQRSYDHLVTLDRLTLTSAFGRAGWRTVSDAPVNDEAWPVAAMYYHYDQEYNRLNVGYQGPHFSYASMPDQYTLAALQRLELDKTDRPPIMAEIDLVSSHTPWAPLPRMVPWDEVGDGSIFDPMPAQGGQPEDVWRDPALVKAAYAQSIAYSLEAITSFVAQARDPNMVLVVLGDHQPASIVTGEGASHDVPISIIAADPAVMAPASRWGWQAGLLPSADAPVWPMESFRDRFLSAYGAGEP